MVLRSSAFGVKGLRNLEIEGRRADGLAFAFEVLAACWFVCLLVFCFRLYV
jgi:hypothetical protein